MKIGKLSCVLLALAAMGSTVQAGTRIIEDSSGSLKSLTSIGDALDSPDHHPVHILYVHGISEIGAGDSAMLREAICTKLLLCNVADWQNAGTEFADHGEFAPGAAPPPLDYLGSPVWNSPAEWQASAPFVDHWVIHLKGHAAPLVVDELNWWPLVLALKCRDVVAAEASVAGPSVRLLQVCSQQAMQDPGGVGHFYPWITPQQATALAKSHPHAVLINRALKQDLIDWGLADVLIVNGPMGAIMRDGLRQLMAKSAAFDPSATASSSAAPTRQGKYDWRTQFAHGNTVDQEFVGVTHSLGSFLLFNTLSVNPVVTSAATVNPVGATTATATPAGASAAAANPVAASAATGSSSVDTQKAYEDSALEYIFQRTSLLYFFANQLEMLEITNLNAVSTAPAGTNPTASSIAPAPNFVDLLNYWQQIQTNFQAAAHPNDPAAREKLQVVAWNDPSDIFTWRVPKIGNVEVVNLYVQNAGHSLGLLESPASAHSHYAQNKQVLEVMFENSAHSSSGK